MVQWCLDKMVSNDTWDYLRFCIRKYLCYFLLLFQKALETMIPGHIYSIGKDFVDLTPDWMSNDFLYECIGCGSTKHESTFPTDDSIMITCLYCHTTIIVKLRSIYEL